MKSSLQASHGSCYVLPPPHLPPNPVVWQANYDVYKEGLKVGQIEETYTREKDHYTLSSTTTPVVYWRAFRPEKIFINSSGLIAKQGLNRCCSAINANAMKTGTVVPN